MSIVFLRSALLASLRALSLSWRSRVAVARDDSAVERRSVRSAVAAEMDSVCDSSSVLAALKRRVRGKERKRMEKCHKSTTK